MAPGYALRCLVVLLALSCSASLCSNENVTSPKTKASTRPVDSVLTKVRDLEQEAGYRAAVLREELLAELMGYVLDPMPVSDGIQEAVRGSGVRVGDIVVHDETFDHTWGRTRVTLLLRGDSSALSAFFEGLSHESQPVVLAGFSAELDNSKGDGLGQMSVRCELEFLRLKRFVFPHVPNNAAVSPATARMLRDSIVAMESLLEELNSAAARRGQASRMFKTLLGPLATHAPDRGVLCRDRWEASKVWFKEVSVDGDKLTLRGHARSADDTAAFLQRFGSLPAFSGVRLLSADERGEDVAFVLEAYINSEL